MPGASMDERFILPTLGRPLICHLRFLICIYALINRRDLAHPAAPVLVFEIENLLFRPVKVIGHKGYLLE